MAIKKRGFWIGLFLFFGILIIPIKYSPKITINIPDIKFSCLLKSKNMSLKKSIEAPMIIKTKEKPRVNSRI